MSPTDWHLIPHILQCISTTIEHLIIDIGAEDETQGQGCSLRKRPSNDEVLKTQKTQVVTHVLTYNMNPGLQLRI
ncbi:hypothetical protein CERSUDRAFT_90052 [Gelatoporia subvermispora B]|uniref:Uncharacterized protein n=1 Tax=Ceriporiopsis subvermispora (strain B) TaxID=914234 RepID=M2RRI3_CERS8|nr:hypothetical protein CERSUDRAFT_90052 [Gelatoporia subvermispora B]